MKWNESTATEFIETALKELQQDQEIYFIGTLAERLNTYRDVFNYLANKFESVKEKKEIIDSILESRLVTGGLHSKINVTMAIFCLKNNYQWRDKQTIENETPGEIVRIEIPKGGRIE